MLTASTVSPIRFRFIIYATLSLSIQAATLTIVGARQLENFSAVLGTYISPTTFSHHYLLPFKKHRYWVTRRKMHEATKKMTVQEDDFCSVGSFGQRKNALANGCYAKTSDDHDYSEILSSPVVQSTAPTVDEALAQGREKRHETILWNHKERHDPEQNEEFPRRINFFSFSSVWSSVRSRIRQWSRAVSGHTKLLRNATILAFSLLLLVGATRRPATAATAVAASSSTGMVGSTASKTSNTSILGPTELSAASALVVLISLIMAPLGLTSLSRQLIIASLRCFVQVMFLGGVTLTYVFSHNDEPYFVMAWLSLVAMVASREASSRAKYIYPGFKRHVLLSILLGTGFVLTTSMWTVLHPRPWWDARVLLPIGGMLLGSVLSAVSLTSNALISDIMEGTNKIDLRLARGATAMEAALPSLQTALRTGLTATINSLSVCGVVHIPGMMTGQILGGKDPKEAASYQVMIMMLIAASAGTTALLAARFVIGSLFDLRRHQLHLSGVRTVEKGGNTGGLNTRMSLSTESSSLGAQIVSVVRTWVNRRHWTRSSHYERADTEMAETDGTPVRASAIERPQDEYHYRWQTNESSPIVFFADNLHVTKTNKEVSFSLGKGDRLAVTGRTGIGKTQLLRTLALLESDGGGDLQLYEVPAPGRHGGNVSDFPSDNGSVPLWRRRICWVPQDRPTLPGTPRQFYEEILTLSGHRQFVQIQSEGSSRNYDSHHFSSSSPPEIASRWSLPKETFDRSWSTLSGGEAQRASLAIALALKPDVLLLDEPTSACDEATTLRMEESLMESGTTCVIVSHSRAQVDRLCTHELQL